MPIRYSCINEGATAVAEHPTGEQAKLAETLQLVLSRVPPRVYQRRTIEDKDSGVNYHYVSNGEGRLVGCAATSDVKTRVVFAFLDAVEPLIRGPTADMKNAKKLLQQKMEFYNNPQNDKISALNDDIHQVVDVMMDNMEKALERGEKVDALQAKSSTLAEQSENFKSKSTELKRNMCLKNAKMTAMIVGVVLVVLLIILLIACKPNFSSCK